MHSHDPTLTLLGYGSHLIIDGFGAEAEALASTRSLAALKELARDFETSVLVERELSTNEGSSALLVYGESHLSLHTFLSKRALCLNVFSRRTLEFERVTSALKKRFTLGRVESYLSSRSRSYHERLDLDALLRGERTYTCARLDESLIAADTER